MDDLLGTVILPIVNFADTQEYELRLPLLHREKWDGDIEGEVEFLLHFSVDVNSLLTEREIHKFYDHLKVSPMAFKIDPSSY